MASLSKRTTARRRNKLKKMGKQRQRAMRKNPPKPLPLNEAEKQ